MKRADKRILDELRVEVGMKERFKTKLVRSMLKWAGHEERMGVEKLAKRSEAQKVWKARKIEDAMAGLR